MALTNSYLLTELGDRLLLESGDGIILEQFYQGFPVLDFWPNWETLPTEYREFSGTVLDNTTGLSVVKPRGDTPRQSMDFTFRLTTREEVRRFRAFIDQVRGRWKSFWIPTWQADLVLTADASGTSLTVSSVGYAGRLFPYAPRKHLALINHDRTISLRGVTAAADNGTTETLTIDAAPESTVLAGSSMISFLLLCRLGNDSVNLVYLNPGHATVNLRVIEVPKEAPTP